MLSVTSMRAVQGVEVHAAFGQQIRETVLQGILEYYCAPSIFRDVAPRTFPIMEPTRLPPSAKEDCSL